MATGGPTNAISEEIFTTTKQNEWIQFGGFQAEKSVAMVSTQRSGRWEWKQATILW
jgi:hypothetical protein